MLLLWNASLDHLGFSNQQGICFEVLAASFTFQQRKCPEFGKPFSRVIISTFNFLISCKILRCNVVRSKHPFSYLHVDTLSGNTHYFHMLTSLVCFLLRTKMTPFSYFFVKKFFVKTAFGKMIIRDDGHL